MKPIDLCCVSSKSGELEALWFRLHFWPFGGRGLILKTRLSAPLFSERNVHVWTLKLPKGYRVQILGKAWDWASRK